MTSIRSWRWVALMLFSCTQILNLTCVLLNGAYV
jgi:hypothetical protein